MPRASPLGRIPAWVLPTWVQSVPTVPGTKGRSNGTRSTVAPRGNTDVLLGRQPLVPVGSLADTQPVPSPPHPKKTPVVASMLGNSIVPTRKEGKIFPFLR